MTQPSPFLHQLSSAQTVPTYPGAVHSAGLPSIWSMQMSPGSHDDGSDVSHCSPAPGNFTQPCAPHAVKPRQPLMQSDALGNAHLPLTHA